MKPSLRQVLADSHIAAVAIAVLFLWSFDLGVRSLGRPLFLAADFLANVVAIRGIPYGSGTFTLGDWLMLIPTFAYLFRTVIALAAAWLLSRWAYGVGPLSGLSDYRAKLARSDHA